MNTIKDFKALLIDLNIIIALLITWVYRISLIHHTCTA